MTMKSVASLPSMVLAMLGALQGQALAECFCLCSNGAPVNICSQPFDRQPICNRICPQSLSQQVPTRNLGERIQTQNVYGPGGIPPGVLPADPREAETALGIALGSPGAGSPSGPGVEATQFGLGTTSAPIGAVAAPQLGAIPTPQIGVLPSGQVGIR